MGLSKERSRHHLRITLVSKRVFWVAPYRRPRKEDFLAAVVLCEDEVEPEEINADGNCLAGIVIGLNQGQDQDRHRGPAAPVRIPMRLGVNEGKGRGNILFRS